MTDEQIMKLVQAFKDAERAKALERSKRWCQQSELNYYEDKMAAIETEFQKAGLNIGLYL